MFLVDPILQKKLEKRRSCGLLRDLTWKPHLIDFASNDYLGFSRCPELNRKIQSQTLGSTGSRLLTGNHAYYEHLEQQIATFHRAEAGLVFNSGYTANLGLLSSVIQPIDTILCDTHIHASVRDGAMLSRAKLLYWRHHDLNHLETRLKQSRGRVFVCIESVYSTDGSIAPIQEIAHLCHQFGAHLIVDEAHATGILGDQGRGVVCAQQCESLVFARIHTFGKALGVHGAIVLGSNLLRHYLINYARSFIYTTALPMSAWIAIEHAYDKLKHEYMDCQKMLHSLCRYFKQRLMEFHLPYSHSETPIQPIQIGNPLRLKSISQVLQNHGFDVRAIVSPTVRQGQECLRICLHTFNTQQEIDQLSQLLCKEIS